MLQDFFKGGEINAMIYLHFYSNSTLVENANLKLNPITMFNNETGPYPFGLDPVSRNNLGPILKVAQSVYYILIMCGYFSLITYLTLKNFRSQLN